MNYLNELFLLFQNQAVDTRRIDRRLNQGNESPQRKFTTTAQVQLGYNQRVQYYRQEYETQNPLARNVTRQIR